jgi:hypothetical protein
MLRLGGVDVGAAGLDGDGLADVADLEGQVRDRQPLAGAEDDVLAFQRAKTLQRDA